MITQFWTCGFLKANNVTSGGAYLGIQHRKLCFLKQIILCAPLSNSVDFLIYYINFIFSSVKQKYFKGLILQLYFKDMCQRGKLILVKPLMSDKLGDPSSNNFQFNA